MIPHAITRDHILRAISEIELAGGRSSRVSTKYLLVHEGKHYPPKLVVSLAAKQASGSELKPSRFSGGAETNNFLKARKFTVIQKGGPEANSKIKTSRLASKPPGRMAPRFCEQSPESHDEHCRDCKSAMLSLLTALYGEAVGNHGLEIGTRPKNLDGHPHHKTLTLIYETLQNLRGHREFVRTDRLPNCDFFVPRPGFVVEFDESQHFTTARAETLRQYPGDLRLGFNRRYWIRQCDAIRAQDNDPPFRDEQRAWYDTLRDFLPPALRLLPTVRLYPKDCVWCRLNPADPRDLETFRQLLGRRAGFWSIDIRSTAAPVLGRVVIDGLWDGEVDLARLLLYDVCGSWAGRPKVRCLSTCGAFLTFDFPDNLPAVGDNLNPSPESIREILAGASQVCDLLLNDNIVGRLRQITDYLTLGVDSWKSKVSTTHNEISERHAELVCLVDLRSGTRRWTGKFYPTSKQAATIMRLPDLKSHFVNLDDQKAMVLGCHDMTVFNPRSEAAARGWRQEVSERFRGMAKSYKPVLVLHHPHTAVKSVRERSRDLA